jgi:C-terminal processing protease CtpA/Prc
MSSVSCVEFSIKIGAGEATAGANVSVGCIVRLQIIPVSATNVSERVTIELKRDEIKLKDGEAHAELIEWTEPNGQSHRIGLIELPSFYRDFTKSNDPDAKSTTRDALLLLNRLKQEGIDGLIMDFRRDSGGSLEEAINLSGLFFSEGPVVQTKSWNGEIAVSRDTDPTIAYDGPMVVLVNRLSASASEIFASEPAGDPTEGAGDRARALLPSVPPVPPVPPTPPVPPSCSFSSPRCGASTSCT